MKNNFLISKKQIKTKILIISNAIILVLKQQSIKNSQSYIQDTEQLDTSTLINMRGESEYPKSLYKKSFISQKNIGSKQQISSHSNKDGGSQKQFEEHEDEEEKKDLQQKFDDADVTA